MGDVPDPLLYYTVKLSKDLFSQQALCRRFIQVGSPESLQRRIVWTGASPESAAPFPQKQQRRVDMSRELLKH